MKKQPPPLPIHAAIDDAVEVIETEDLSAVDRTLVAPSLRPVGGPKSQKGFPIRLDAATSVGRARRNDIVIASDLASAEHCVIEIAAEGLIVRDLGSTNGTFVNGARVERSVLRNGDRLRVGKVVLVVDLHGGA